MTVSFSAVNVCNAAGERWLDMQSETCLPLVSSDPLLSPVSAGSPRTYRCSGGKSTTAWRTRPTASIATTWWADIPHSRVSPCCRRPHLAPPLPPSPLCIGPHRLPPPLGPDAQGSSPQPDAWRTGLLINLRINPPPPPPPPFLLFWYEHI